MNLTRLVLRRQRVADAARFLEILRHPDFVHFPPPPTSMAAERVFLRKNVAAWRAGTGFHFSLLWYGRVIGAVGLRPDSHRRHVAEVGYFIDRRYWGRGFATEALQRAERFAVERLQLRRLEIMTLKPNVASQRVAQKCGFRREGLRRGHIRHGEQFLDAYLFGKVLPAETGSGSMAPSLPMGARGRRVRTQEVKR